MTRKFPQRRGAHPARLLLLLFSFSVQRLLRVLTNAPDKGQTTTKCQRHRRTRTVTRGNTRSTTALSSWPTSAGLACCLGASLGAGPQGCPRAWPSSWPEGPLAWGRKGCRLPSCSAHSWAGPTGGQGMLRWCNRAQGISPRPGLLPCRLLAVLRERKRPPASCRRQQVQTSERSWTAADQMRHPRRRRSRSFTAVLHLRPVVVAVQLRAVCLCFMWHSH